MATTGKKIWNREKTECGEILSEGRRMCAACGPNSPCYRVKWSDGKITKPCASAVEVLGNGDLHIL